MNRKMTRFARCGNGGGRAASGRLAMASALLPSNPVSAREPKPQARRCSAWRRGSRAGAVMCCESVAIHRSSWGSLVVGRFGVCGFDAGQFSGFGGLSEPADLGLEFLKVFALVDDDLVEFVILAFEVREMGFDL